MQQRVLVVEDDEIQRNVLAGFLETHEFVVETAMDGLDGFRKAWAGRFDVVVTDYRMPEFDGLSVARLMMEFADTHTRPLMIGLSASLGNVLAAGKGGANPFDTVLSKPWQPEALLASMRQPRAVTDPRRHDIAMAPLPLHEAAPAGLADIQPFSVLVVDDSDMFRTMLSSALQSCGFMVRTAPSGLAALHMLRMHDFDVAVIDFRMPDIDGVALAKLICDLVPPAHRPSLIALSVTPERLGTSASIFDEIADKSAGLLPVIDAVERCAANRKP